MAKLAVAHSYLIVHLTYFFIELILFPIPNSRRKSCRATPAWEAQSSKPLWRRWPHSGAVSGLARSQYVPMGTNPHSPVSTSLHFSLVICRGSTSHTVPDFSGTQLQPPTYSLAICILLTIIRQLPYTRITHTLSAQRPLCGD